MNKASEGAVVSVPQALTNLRCGNCGSEAFSTKLIVSGDKATVHSLVCAKCSRRFRVVNSIIQSHGVYSTRAVQPPTERELEVIANRIEKGDLAT